MQLKIYVIGSSQTRTDILDGSTRIFIECAKRWIKKGHRIHIFTCEEGHEIFQKYGLTNLSYTIIRSSKYKPFDIYFLYLIRTIKLCMLMIRFSLQGGSIVVYSGSDFSPDSLPALTLKLRAKKKIKWIAGFYLFAPNPFSRETPYKGKHFVRGLLYYLSQMPIYGLVKKYADMVWVTNEMDRWKFIDDKRFTPDRVIAVRGGVDVKMPALIPEPEEKEFDAIFIGRFHPQKGVLELIDIWRYVCETKKDAKLAMIGVGELENEIRAKIKKYGLENNIVLCGFKDGIEKLKIFKNSKIVVHPAIYDSGGMAPCEAMACGLPGVSFDLPALRTYYPKGMLKTPCYDLKAFAENILKLLNDEEWYRRLQKEALEWAKEWDWDKRAEELLKAIGSYSDLDAYL
jgi:glycosyltransferase involved in cell wall biosynthesis